MSDYFHSSNEAEKRATEAITNRIHKEFNYLFSGKGYIEGKFSLQVKEGSHPYLASTRRIAYALQKPLKDELE